MENKESDLATSVHKESINFGHLATIALCAFLLLGLTFFKGGLNFNFFKTAKNEEGKQYTFKQAEADALAELNGSLSAAQNGGKAKDQIAMLDPNGAGQVLGASTEDEGIFPNVEDVLTKEILSQIKLNLNGPATNESVKKYKMDLTAVESDNEAENIFVALGSTDPKVLTDASKKIEPLVKAMLAVEVPNELADFHKIKMIYYMQLSELADGYAGIQGAADPKDTGINIFSLVEKMQRMTQDISAKFGVDL